jgi:MFS family permease
MAVTLGFVVGTAISAAFTLVDWIGARRLFCIATVAGALANAALLVWMDAFAVVITCRFITGLMLAGAYPPGMKLAASWFVEERGFAVGSLVGALTFGTALPHFFNFLGGLAWPPVIAGTSLAAVAGAAIFLLTLVSIRLYPAMVAVMGWPASFAFLAPGPFLGTLAMWRLRRLPESYEAASGQALRRALDRRWGLRCPYVRGT